MRVLVAFLLAVSAVAGLRSPAQAPPASNESARTVAGIESADVPLSNAFLAASPPASAVTAEATGRPATPQLRTARLSPTDFAAPCAGAAARVTALKIRRLAFARALDAARSGYFTFGSTAPPPLHG